MFARMKMALALAIVLGTGSATLAASNHRSALRQEQAVERQAARAAFGRANRIDPTLDDPHYSDMQPGGMLAR
jgi:hypothetical protein